MIELLSRVGLLGNAWVFYWLFGFSILAVGVMIDRWIVFRARRDDADKLGDDLIARLRDGDVRGADQVLAASPSFEAAVVRPALQWLDGGPAAVEDALEAEARRRRRELGRGMITLRTIAKSAPFIGLLGTVIGLVHAFHLFAEDANVGAIRNLFFGISQGLVAGGVGLFVAVVAIVAHEVIGKSVDDIEGNIGVISKTLVAHLKSESSLAAQFDTLEDGPESETVLPVGPTFESGELPGGRSARMRELD